ncbi:DUF1192 domain-containing protein [Brevundimonas vesicularis]|uniref:DUF1192 domain-containing protein n=1 Tax=Brevundimonas vesicularis TaxID=41276 RepID=UPI0038D48C6F
MSFEDLEPRTASGSPLGQLVREDLDLYAVADLEERIALLEGEIARTRAAIDTKGSKRSAADALFKF